MKSNNNNGKKNTDKKVFGTKEWASENFNYISGCIHDCKYCYSKAMAVKYKRKTTENWRIEEVREKDLNKKAGKKDGIIMFPSSHDITPNLLDNHLLVLGKLLSAGNNVLIVSKPHYYCIQRICNSFSQYLNQILFRFTIGSSDTEVLKFWEPGAPTFAERLKSLKYAYNKGFQTSISCEPLLDFKVEKLIDNTLPFITDSFWIGKANMLLGRLKQNGITDETTLKRAKELLDWQGNDENFNNLYRKYKENPIIKWKESVKKVLGIEISKVKGLDI